MINILKKNEKDIPPEKLNEYKREARILAGLYDNGLEPSWWRVDVDGDVRLIVHDPYEDMERWIQDRIDGQGKD